MLGEITATFSITESSIRIEDVFFSVAITMPFVAIELFSLRKSKHAGSVRTFDPQTRCALSDRSQCVLNLHELPTWGEDCQGIARLANEIKMRFKMVNIHLYAPPSALAIY